MAGEHLLRARRRSRRPSRAPASPRSPAPADCPRRSSPPRSARERGFDRACIAARAHPLEPRDLRRRAPRRCRHRAGRPRSPRPSWYLLTPTIVSSPRSMRRLAARRGLLDAQLRHAGSRPPWSCRPSPRPRRSAPSPPRRSNGSGSRRNSCRRADRRHAGCRSPRRGSAGCCGRSAPRPGSAGPAPRRTNWCAATGCRRAPPPAPRSSCG